MHIRTCVHVVGSGGCGKEFVLGHVKLEVTLAYDY